VFVATKASSLPYLRNLPVTTLTPCLWGRWACWWRPGERDYNTAHDYPSLLRTFQWRQWSLPMLLWPLVSYQVDPFSAW